MFCDRIWKVVIWVNIWFKILCYVFVHLRWVRYFELFILLQRVSFRLFQLHMGNRLDQTGDSLNDDLLTQYFVMYCRLTLLLQDQAQVWTKVLYTNCLRQEIRIHFITEDLILLNKWQQTKQNLQDLLIWRKDAPLTSHKMTNSKLKFCYLVRSFRHKLTEVYCQRDWYVLIDRRTLMVCRPWYQWWSGLRTKFYLTSTPAGWRKRAKVRGSAPLLHPQQNTACVDRS